MQIVKTRIELDLYLAKYRLDGASIGFVPTMGALHEGHMSLIKRALSENDIAVSSVFVNPTQFNDPADYLSYPRQIQLDADKLERAGCTVLFNPEPGEVYPEPDGHEYLLGDVTNRLEGEFRPGHFNGVASVVKRLFELVKPHKAYFGLKDYQQFLVIKALTERYKIPVTVIGCNTVRDSQGLAMSSRNQLLTAADRAVALHLHRSLLLVKKAWQVGQRQGLEALGIEYLQKVPGIDLEYFDLAQDSTLRHLGDAAITADDRPVALLAARINGVRLIDNMPLT